MAVDQVSSIQKAMQAILKLRIRGAYVAAALGAICFVMSISNRSSLSDDAYIFVNYAHHLVTEGKWSLDGRNVSNGVTSPLYTLLLALVAAVSGGDAERASVYLNGIIWALWGVGTYALLQCYVPNRVGQLLSALLIITFPFFAWLYRMESHLTMTAALFTGWLFVRGSFGWMGLLAGLTFLSRPDTVLFLGPLFAFFFLTDRRALCKAIAALAVPLLPWFVYSYWAFGKLMPDTLTAKLAQGSSGYWPLFIPGLRDLTLQAFWYTPASLFPFALALVGGTVWAFKGILRRLEAGSVTENAALLTLRSRVLAWIMCLHAAALILAYGLVLRVPNYHWYYAAPFFWSLFYCSVFLGRQISQQTPGTSLALIGLTLVTVGQQWLRNPTLHFKAIEDVGRADYRAVGDYLREHTPAGATIGVSEVGLLSWISKRPLIDALGLGDPELSRKIATRDIGFWLRRKQPDYVLLQGMAFNKATPCLDWPQVPWFARAYKIEKDFKLNGRSYQLYRKDQDLEKVILEMAGDPPRVAFCIDHGDDAYVLGATMEWTRNILACGKVASIKPRAQAGLVLESPETFLATNTDPVFALDIPGRNHAVPDGSRRWFLRIRMTLWNSLNGASDDMCQLFIATSGATDFREENCLRARAYMDGVMHNYYLPLALPGGWVAMPELQALRFDPATRPSRIKLESVELCVFP